MKRQKHVYVDERIHRLVKSAADREGKKMKSFLTEILTLGIETYNKMRIKNDQD